jgi:3-phenylpropionate/trans-cinnamate dioxygenase ferredoxin reductase component
MPRQIVVIGGGPAAVAAAMAAKRVDAAASVTVVTDEACEPYEKPPLSKAVLLAKAKPEDAPIAGPGGLQQHGVTVQLDCRCTAIDRARQSVLTIKGALSYDALVLATGASVRELPLLPSGTPSVRYLRSEVHARRIRDCLTTGRRLVVVGAGLIGLEVAASAAELGVAVAVVDVAPRLMERVCDPQTSAIIQAEHQRHGVTFALSTTLIAAAQRADGGIDLKADHGPVYEADLVLVGIGVRPDDQLAITAGLQVQDGILVDAQCRTSDPNIFAAGDVARFATPTGPVRLENWRHAQEHGAVAGSNAAGAANTYNPVPSFWSEQYALYIQGVGWPEPSATLVRRQLPKDGVVVLGTKAGIVANCVGINAQRDLAAIRRLIERKIPVDVSHLADPGRPFVEMLQGKAT